MSPRKKYDEDHDQNDFSLDSVVNNKLLDRLDYENESDGDWESESDIDDNKGEIEQNFDGTAFDDNFDPDTVNSQKKKKRIANIKPKLIGKHSLAYDTVFKGKKTESKSSEPEHIMNNITGGFDLNEESMEFNESRNSIDNQLNLKLQQEVFNILKTCSDIDFNAPRRKPSVGDLNSYFKVITEQLEHYGFSYCEMFIEMSTYFSDNVYGIYQLLYKKYKDLIVKELVEKYGLKELNKINFI